VDRRRQDRRKRPKKNRVLIVSGLILLIVIIYVPLVKSKLADEAVALSDDPPPDPEESEELRDEMGTSQTSMASGTRRVGQSWVEPTLARAEQRGEQVDSGAGSESFGFGNFGRESTDLQGGGESSTAPTLNGVLRFGREKLAIVDGRLVRRGDRIAGGTVEEIHGRSIVLRSRSRREIVTFTRADGSVEAEEVGEQFPQRDS